LRRQASIGLTISTLSALASLLLGGVLLFQFLSSRKVAEKDRHLAATVFANSVEAIVITDAKSNIVDVNRSFTRITGYASEEVIGQQARILKSGKNDDDFYAGMWTKLLQSGSWEGEVSNQRKNGEVYPALLSIVAAKDARGEITNYIAMIVDISKRKRAEGQLEQLRTFDSLTGLLSRSAWVSAMERAVANSRTMQQKFALLEIGLDRFKLINDSLSHEVGDKVLTEAAERLRKVLRRQDAAARLGGDRFSILLEDIHSRHNVDAICEKLLAAFIAPIMVDQHELHVSISIGVAIHPDDGRDTGALQRNAEAAMYCTKKESRGGYRYYAAGMNEEGAQLLTLERMLRLALERQEFTLHYQPQVNASDGCLIGVEALLRWNSRDLGAVSPAQFIPIAEETGLILPIGIWVMRQACRDAQSWRRRLGRDLPVAVNLSARQFRSQELLVTVQEVLDETGLPSHLLELEITEGLLIVDPEGAATVLAGLRAMGVRTALDDFGTGYSSLAYLKNFPLDRLKIDRTFVRDLPTDRNDQAISRAVVALGRSLNMEVLAEGVETPEQGSFLTAAGCQLFQGNFYGEPMSADHLMAHIRCGALSLGEEAVCSPG
jgi:diguanylate cyclase (GGDEF)-like protein/PAS domain S-box-containing protein